LSTKWIAGWTSHFISEYVVKEEIAHREKTEGSFFIYKWLCVLLKTQYLVDTIKESKMNSSMQRWRSSEDVTPKEQKRS